MTDGNSKRKCLSAESRPVEKPGENVYFSPAAGRKSPSVLVSECANSPADAESESNGKRLASNPGGDSGSERKRNCSLLGITL